MAEAQCQEGVHFEVKVPCVCSVVHVRTCWRCCATLRATAPFIHSFTCRHKATAPQATHAHMTVYVSCRAACAVVRVCTVRSLRVCACGVWAHFFAQGELTRPSASSGAHRPRSTLAVHGCVLEPEGGGRWKVEVR